MRELRSYYLTPGTAASIDMESDAEILCVTHYDGPFLWFLSGSGPIIQRDFLFLTRGSVPPNAKYINSVPVEISGSGSPTPLHVFELMK